MPVKLKSVDTAPVYLKPEEISGVLASSASHCWIEDSWPEDATIDGYFNLERAAKVLNRLIARRIKNACQAKTRL